MTIGVLQEFLPRSTTVKSFSGKHNVWGCGNALVEDKRAHNLNPKKENMCEHKELNLVTGRDKDTKGF
jgi:hypothetical protein